MSKDPLADWLDWLRQCGDGATPWTAALQQAMEQLAERLSTADDWRQEMEDAGSRFLAVVGDQMERGDALLGQCQHWLQALAPTLPRDGEDSPLAWMLGPLNAWPALGPAAARDREWRELQDALPALQRASRDHALCLFAMLEDALSRWHRELAEEDTPPGPELLRETWLTALETAWQAMLDNARYLDSLRRLNTSTATLQQAGGRLVETLSRVLQLPTRRDLLGTQQRLHSLRRQLPPVDLGEELVQLRGEVDSLRAELAELRSRVGSGGQS